jgi:hypothetical protein
MACQQREAQTDRLRLCGGMMAKRIRHYRRKVHRQAKDRTTTQHIFVEERFDHVYLIVYEVGRAKDKYGYIIRYGLRPVLRKRYFTLEEAYRRDETVFDVNMNLGFREVIADTSAEG